MQETSRILIVDDDPSVLAALGKILQGVAELRFATSGHDALRLSQRSVPDLILLDVEMPGMTGFDVCSAMKQVPGLADVPVIFITSHNGTEQEVMGLSLGGADFIAKPISPPLVLARVRMHLRMKQMSDALRRAAFTDVLTGVANRRQFDEALHREWLRAQRSGSPMALLMVDIDQFKRYNDHYGHQEGDHCLRSVAQAMQLALQRPADLLARYGGEEFALVLPDTDKAGARIIALRILDAIEVLRLPHAASSVAPTVTVSVGASAYDEDCVLWVGQSSESRFSSHERRPPVADLLAAADAALYAAKGAGRRQAHLLSIDDLGVPGMTTALKSSLVSETASVDDPSGVTRAVA